MNIVEAFFITLGLDTSEYQKKEKEVTTSLKKFGEASDKQTKLIAESGKKAAGAFSALKIEILGALAAFGMGAGFKAFVLDSMNGQAQLGRLSTALGVSTHHLQAWKLMAREMGGSGAEAIGTMQKVAAGMAAARRGDISFLATANKYGAGLQMGDNVETTMAKLNRMAYAIRQKYGAQQAMGVLNEVGISDLNQQLRLTEDPAKFAADFAHAMSLTGAATKDSTEQAARLQAEWADLQERFRQVGERVFVKLEPVLAKLGEQLANWLDHIDWNKVINAIGQFIDKVQAIVKEMGGWKTVAEILGGVLAVKILSPLLGVIGALGKMLPLLGGASRGVAVLASSFGSLGLAVAAAAGAGGIIGHEIWKHLLEGTKAGDDAGSFVAHVMAELGDKDAQEAIDRMNGKGPVNHSGDYHPERTAAYQDKSKFAVEYFKQQGFSLNESIGMAANIARESSFNPQSVGDNGKAFGLGQWHPDRQATFAKVMGKPIQGSTFRDQLQFYAWEVSHNKKLMQMMSGANAESSAMLVSMLNERPADREGEAQRRAVIAHNMSQMWAPQLRAELAAKRNSSTNTNTVSIGTMNVNAPKATDAPGVAMGMKKALRDNPLIAGSVTALA